MARPFYSAAGTPQSMFFSLTIGGVSFTVYSSTVPLVFFLKDFYGCFLTKKKPEYSLGIEIKKDGVSGKKAACCAVAYTDGVYSVDTEEFSLSFDEAARKGKIIIVSAWPQAAAVTAIKNICIFLTVRRGGIVLHASGVLRSGKAYIFTGPSGAGKSTAARLSYPNALLSEETIGIIKKKNGTFAFGIPYSKEPAQKEVAGGMYRVAGIYTLIKDTRNYTRRLSRAEAAAGIFTVPFGLSSIVSSCQLMERCDKVGMKEKIQELHFRDDVSFWECIDEHTA